MKINVLILTGYGINAEKELAWAFKKAGGIPKITHLSDVIEDKTILKNYQVIAFPGGFSFGDHIASGKVFANLIKNSIMDELNAFIASGKLVIGICNGFQIITKLGIIPDISNNQKQTASLVQNDSGHFEDRWVWVEAINKTSPWLNNINKLYLPIRHGEGKFITDNQETLNKLNENNQVAFRYINPNSNDAPYPFNPNGSIQNIAGILNTKGNVLGLMPHPEAYIFKENHPRWTEGYNIIEELGLKIFQNGINYLKKHY